MNGLTILKKSDSKNTLLQIDTSAFVNKPRKIEDLIDIVLAEIRSNEQKLDWETAKKFLKKSEDIR
jgi:hypothetical protein